MAKYKSHENHRLQTRYWNSVFRISPYPLRTFQQVHGSLNPFYSDSTVCGESCICKSVLKPLSHPNSTPETVPVADAKEIRIYAVDNLSRAVSGPFFSPVRIPTTLLIYAKPMPTSLTAVLNPMTQRVLHVYHPETSYQIPTLADWVEVVNSDTNGQLIWVGLA